MNEAPLLILVDGNSLVYRAFFAVPDTMTTSSGQPTNAVYGFTRMLLNLVRDHKPSKMAVAFDRAEPTFRHQRLDSYKATRDAMPEALSQQMNLVRQMIQTLGITAIDHFEVEADDIIATLASQARDQGHDVIVVTGDRDSYQLVQDPHIRVLYNKRGVSDYVLYDEAGILERTGVRPSDYVAYAALRGDTSDNLAGVDGVGEKTAAKLINSYGDIVGLYEHLDEQTPKLRQNLGDARQRVDLNLEMMELVRDVPLEVGLDDLGFARPDMAAVAEIFVVLESQNLRDFAAEVLNLDLLGVNPTIQTLEATICPLATPDEVAELFRQERTEPVAVAACWGEPVDERQPQRCVLLGISVLCDLQSGEVAWLPASVLAQMLAVDGAANAGVANGGLADEVTGQAHNDNNSQWRSAICGFFDTAQLVIHDAKPFLYWLQSHGVDASGLCLDTQIAAYLLDPVSGRYELGELLRAHTALQMPESAQPQEGQLDLHSGEDKLDVSQRCALQAVAVGHLAAPLAQALEAQGLRQLNEDIEVPLVRVLARMEHAGIAVNEAALVAIRDRLVADAERLRALVLDAAGGGGFNVNSSKQVGELLFDKLGLPPQKKTRTGAYSTDARTLEKLRGEHPVVDALLDYREVEKLRSTYGEGLVAAVEAEPDNRIRATFKQTVARTGRLSSDAPNLHNIPVRTDAGRVFREVFVAAKGCELLVADYNQIELRCIAHLAEDPGLIAAFESGLDVHTSVAAQVFAIPADKVSAQERSVAKMVSYGLIYGMEAYGLGQRLNIGTREAAVFLEAFFTAFPALRAYMDKAVADAAAVGYTETLFGRRRRIPEMNSPNPHLRQAAERQAMNSGIQGLAADIFKVALVRLDSALQQQGLASQIILQVHDEVILEVPHQEHHQAARLTQEIMAGACDLKVPLEVHLSSGQTWAEAK